MDRGTRHGWWVIAVTAAAAVLCALAARASAASVRAACAGPVPARYAQCFALQRTDVGSIADAALAPNVAPSGYGPADLRAAYGLAGPSASGGDGATVAIVDAYNDPNAESDLAVYRSQFGLPSCTTANGCFLQVNQSGQASPLPANSTGWAGEISLDLDMVSAICPNCHIVLVEATTNSFTNLSTAIARAVTMGAGYVSNSWGGDESSGEANLDYPGVAITASTGDSGFGAQWPAAAPLVTAVGGTRLTRSGSTWSESAWSGAGAGCSAYEPKPAWQADTGCAHRAIADVSAVADPSTGVAVYQTYGDAGWTVYGGTSVSARIIASVYALAGTPGDQPSADPYLHRSALHDVTSGNDGQCSGLAPYLCTAGLGYDGPTGLGTPNGTHAFSAVDAPSTTTLAVTPNPAPAGQAVAIAATVQGSAGPTPTGTVTFSDGGGTIGAAALDSSGRATLSTSSLPAGRHSITASYGGDAANDPSTSAAVDETVSLAPVTTTTTTKTTTTTTTSTAPAQQPPASPSRAATPAGAASPLLTCRSAQVALIDAVPQGGVVRFTGVAAPGDAGKTVRIALASTHQVVAVAAVGAGGAFAAMADPPPKRLRASARYTAGVGGATSAALKLQRRSYLTRVSASGNRVSLGGKVTGAFRKGAKVTIEEIARCAIPVRIATARLSSTGTWRASATVPGGVAGLLFRARATVLTGRRATGTVSLLHPASVAQSP